jgi:hypothetical protein
VKEELRQKGEPQIIEKSKVTLTLTALTQGFKLSSLRFGTSRDILQTS